ncbi:MAG: hypothetical protein ABTQ73_08520 [Caldilineales bacterium]
MASELQTLLQAVFAEDPTPAPACATCRQALSGYVDAQLAGEDAAQRFPAVQAHLMQCTMCQEVYDELTVLLAAAAADTLVQPPVAPAFNFAYLNTPPAASHPWRWDNLGRLVIRFSSELLAALQVPALRPAYLKSSAAGGWQMEAGDAADDLRVQVQVEPQRRSPDLVTVEVEVDVPSRGGWPHLADLRVTLRQGDTLLAEQLTDPFGKAVFEQIPAATLPQLVIVVEK